MKAVSIWSTFLGLVAVMVVGVVAAQRPQDAQKKGRPRRSFRAPIPPQSSLGLLGLPEVRKEIELRGDQQKDLDTLLQEIREGINSSFRDALRGAFGLSATESRQRFDGAIKNVAIASEKAEQRLASVLDEKQVKRLKQLRLQREGLSAFGRSDVSKQLKLTDEQQRKIRSLTQAGRRDQSQAVAEVQSQLTADQKAAWNKLVGKIFRFPQSRSPGFGRREVQVRDPRLLCWQNTTRTRTDGLTRKNESWREHRASPSRERPYVPLGGTLVAASASPPSPGLALRHNKWSRFPKLDSMTRRCCERSFWTSRIRTGRRSCRTFTAPTSKYPPH